MQFSTDTGNAKQAWWPAMISVIAAVHSSLTVGYAYGYTSTALEQLSELPDGYAFRLGSISADLFVTLVPGGAFVCCLLSGVVTDRIGRKKTLLLTGIPNAVGWILIAVSPYVTAAGPSVFKALILTGRFLTGVASSGVYASIPLYAVEVALSKQRGYTGTLHQLFNMMGMSLSYVVGSVSVLSYNQSAIIAVGFVFIYPILTAIIPESPRWLLMKGDDAGAIKVLEWLRRSRECAYKEAAEIKKVVESSPKLTCKEKMALLCKQHVLLPVIVNLGISFFYHLSGQQVLLVYSSIIMRSAGVDSPEVTAACSVGIVQIFGVIISSFLVEQVGRKPLLAFGGFGTGIAAALLGTHFYNTRPSLCQLEGESLLNASHGIFNDSSQQLMSPFTIAFDNATGKLSTEVCNRHYAPLAIFSLVLFSVTYSVGYRCVVSIVKAEMLPLLVRGLTISLIDTLGWVLIIVSAGFYYSYEQEVRPYSAWWSFAVVNFIGALFVVALVPETKGKSLEEIEMMYRSKEVCCLTTGKYCKGKREPNPI